MNKVYIICGSPAAGKTTYGKKLAELKKALFLDIDTATERLIQIALFESGHNKNDRDSDYFKSTYREAIYMTMFDIARDNLKWNDVVIVGPFTLEIKNKFWPEKLENKLKNKVEIHYIFCNHTERYNRMVKRSNQRDDSKLKDWDNLNSYYNDDKPPEFKHIFVDTSRKKI